MKLRMEAVAAKVRELAGEKRQQLAEEWLEKVDYCLGHMDETEFGVDFVRNLEWLLDMGDAKHVLMRDRVVTNTLQLLATELTAVLGRKRSKLHVLADMNVRESLLPAGRWVWRGYHSTMRKTEHGFRVEFSAEKNDCAQEMEGVIAKLTRVI